MEFIGLMGGTFDPIHLGHLAAAEGAAEAIGLDLVRFVPNRLPPHKEAPQTASEHRAAMVLAAIAGNPRFGYSGLELEGQGPSYTVGTVQAMKERHPGSRFALIVGMDSLVQIKTWREYERLLRLVELMAVVTRPGYRTAEGQAVVGSLPPDLGRRVRIVERPGLDISSTELRAMAGRGESLRYLVPDPVCAYIAEHSLYTR